MGAEILSVTTSARRLWDLVHRPVGHALAELDGGPHDFRLGGGTVLAARWHHRDSFDIDLVVERSTQRRSERRPPPPSAEPYTDTWRSGPKAPSGSSKQRPTAGQPDGSR